MNDIIDFLSNIYSKYHNLIEYSEYAFTGWILSWILFFIMLPFMFRFFGKVKGGLLNYGFSWVSMVIIILGLEFSIK
jgi:hypothetical protein